MQLRLIVMVQKIQLIALFVFAGIAVNAQDSFRFFELRYFTDSIAAQGVTGWNGDSTFFDTAMRLESLNAYATYAKKFFNNPDLDLRPITKQKVDSITATIKPLPGTRTRKSIALNNWKWETFKAGERERQQKQIQEWTKSGEAKIVENALYATKEYKHSSTFTTPQDWRFSLQWEVKIPQTTERSAFVILDEESNPIVLVGITSDGGCFYKSRLGLPIGVGQFSSGTLVNFKLFVDIEAGRFSLYLNNELKADFVRALSSKIAHKFFVQMPNGSRLDNVFGISYQRPTIVAEKGVYPLTKGNMFLDERFELSPEIGDLGIANFDDTNWKSLQLPVNSGDRFRGRELILRNTVAIQDFHKAILHFEHISPETEIWLNNKVIYVHRTGRRLDLDISKDLLPNHTNLLMLRLRRNDGWYLGVVNLELIGESYIQALKVETTKLTDTAFLQIKATLLSEALTTNQNGLWKGKLNIRVFPFLPEEGARPIINHTIPVTLRTFREENLEELIPVIKPKLWTTDSPNLYKIAFYLLDENDQEIDDLVVVTGFRTLSQQGGSFRLNNQIMPLYGGNLSDYLPFSIDAYDSPADSTDAWLVRAIESLKRMNGNVFRVGQLENIDLDRLTQLCDQFGVMLIQQPETGMIANQPWSFVSHKVEAHLQHFYHHPSIVMWQVPDSLMFQNYVQDATEWTKTYYQTIMRADASRLIAITGVGTNFGEGGMPNSDGTKLYDSKRRVYRLLNDASVWTAEKVIRGNSSTALSRGADWDDFSIFPVSVQYDTLIINYLKNRNYLYLDYNAESIAGQENPFTVKGSPYRYSEVYQSPYPDAAIGQTLTYNDWLLSQSYQGFVLYEAIRKRRWLGYDGLLYTNLWNGADPTTLLDGSGYTKLGYHAMSMGLQPVIAGSKTTDMAYIPDQAIPVFIQHVGKRGQYQVVVSVKDLSGKVLKTQKFPTVALPNGNVSIEIGQWKNDLNGKGWYVVEYEVQAIKN